VNSLQRRLRSWLIAIAIGMALAGTTIATTTAQETQPCAGNKSCREATGVAGLPAKDTGTAETDIADAASKDSAPSDDASDDATSTETAPSAPTNSTSSTTGETTNDSTSSVTKSDEAAAGEACSDVPGVDGVLSCYCELDGLEGGTWGGIWGTHLYTIDSTICIAAVHAGALKPIL